MSYYSKSSQDHRGEASLRNQIKHSFLGSARKCHHKQHQDIFFCLHLLPVWLLRQNSKGKNSLKIINLHLQNQQVVDGRGGGRE